MIQTGAGLALFLLMVLFTPPALAEVVTLVDNTQVSGKLTHYFDGVLVLETTNGQKLELPREKIKQITFKLPPPRAEFSTPEKVRPVIFTVTPYGIHMGGADYAISESARHTLDAAIAAARPSLFQLIRGIVKTTDSLRHTARNT